MPKVLVVDDSIAVRKVAERLLTEASLTVTLAANGEEALTCLAKERPDVIVSDVIMPDKSGYEVCAFVRGSNTLSTIPVLLISGIVNDEVTKQAESCRADGVLKKPFQGTSLKDKVLELLAKRMEPAPSPAPPVLAPVQAPVPVQAPAPVPVQTYTAVVTSVASPAPGISPEQMEAHRLTASRLKDVEEQLRAERARAESAAGRLAELEGQLGRAKSTELELAAAQQRMSDFESQVAKLELQVSRIPLLESALKAEQDVTAILKHEAAGSQKAAGRVAELDAALNAEREAAAQLVQQLTDLEQTALKVKDLETKLVLAEHRALGLQQKAKDAEAALDAERTKVEILHNKVAAAERAAQSVSGAHQLESTEKIRELEVLLTTERGRNELLARRLSEAELAAEGATKRFEDMARKLGEIAGLASQLGNGKGRS
jgi:CheY-like chemotaxis protein